MTRKNKILIIRIIIAILIWVSAIIIEHTVDYSIGVEITYLSLYVVAYLISGYDILIGAVKHVISGSFLDEYFLMSIATIGAFMIRFFGDTEYLEAVAVMIFFQIGEVFQGIASERSRNAIMSTMDLSVTKCTLINQEVVNPEDVNIGDVIIVKPGEMVPLDGIMETDGVLNMKSLTGEALDVDFTKGDSVLSGSINMVSPINIKVTKKYYDSTATKILDMVENATMKKAKSERFISKFAQIYTPIVVGLALILGGIVPLIISIVNNFNDVGNVFSSYIYAALTCLVISCPCALVISVPLSYFAGIGANAKNKIIVKGGIDLDNLSYVDTIIMDKTGTLTKAEFEISNIYGDKDEVLRIAKGLEINSTHPIAKAINKLDVDYYKFDIKETPGFGIVGNKDNINFVCGSKKLLQKHNIEPIEINDSGSALYIAKDNKCIGAIVLNDIIKEEAKDSISKLLSMGKRIVVLSGDREASVKDTCDRLGIKEYYAGLLPQDKLEIVERIMKSKDSGKVAFIGDGINDAPTLAISNVGVSMGQVGSDAAIEASDVVVLNDNLTAIPKMLNIAKKTKRIVLENIIFIILIKVIILILSAFGSMNLIEGFKLPMWVAIFGDVGVCVIAILNAMRALKTNEKS